MPFRPKLPFGMLGGKHFTLSDLRWCCCFQALAALRWAKCTVGRGAFAPRKHFRMTSHTHVVRRLALWSIVAAMLWFGRTSRAQELHGEALVKAS